MCHRPAPLKGRSPPLPGCQTRSSCQAIAPVAPSLPSTSMRSGSAPVTRCWTRAPSHGTATPFRPEPAGLNANCALPCPTHTKVIRYGLRQPPAVRRGLGARRVQGAVGGRGQRQPLLLQRAVQGEDGDVVADVLGVVLRVLPLPQDAGGRARGVVVQVGRAGEDRAVLHPVESGGAVSGREDLVRGDQGAAAEVALTGVGVVVGELDHPRGGGDRRLTAPDDERRGGGGRRSRARRRTRGRVRGSGGVRRRSRPGLRLRRLEHAFAQLLRGGLGGGGQVECQGGAGRFVGRGRGLRREEGGAAQREREGGRRQCLEGTYHSGLLGCVEVVGSSS